MLIGQNSKGTIHIAMHGANTVLAHTYGQCRTQIEKQCQEGNTSPYAPRKIF